MASNYVAGVYAPRKSTTFMDDYNTYEKKLQNDLTKNMKTLSDRRSAYRTEQSQIADAYRSRMKGDTTNAINKSNAEYDNAARQNYINYQRAQKDLPSQLNALGIRGGASESSALRLGTNYGSNVASNESARNASITALRQALEQQLADYDKEYRQLLSAYDETYNTNVQNMRSTNAEKLASAYATALANQKAADEKAAANDLSQFAQAIDGQYDNEKDYLSLITALTNSNDPNKSAKIMLTRQALNKWKEKQAELAAKQAELAAKSSGGGGGGGYSSRSYGGGGYSSGGGGNDSGGNDSAKSYANSVANHVYNTAQAVTNAITGNKSSSSSGGGGNYSSMTDKYYKTLSKSYTPSSSKSSSSSSSSSKKSSSSKTYSKSSKYGTRWKWNK